MEGVCLRKASISVIGIGLIAYPDVSGVSAGGSVEFTCPLAELEAELLPGPPDAGRTPCTWIL